MQTIEDVRALLDRLDGEPADALESDWLEFKRWDPARLPAQLTAIRETVVAFANAKGGYLVLGVDDRKRTRAAAIHGAAAMDTARLRRDIYDGTDPPILVEIEELAEPEGRLAAIRVPPGLPPHSTTAGKTLIRVGKESKPLTGVQLGALLMQSRELDLSAVPLSDAGRDDLDPAEIERMRRYIRLDEGQADLAGLGDDELLEELGLTKHGGVTRAAVILLGQPAALASTVRNHEVIVLRRRDRTSYELRRNLRQPLLALMDEVEGFTQANLAVTTVQPSGFQEFDVPNLIWRVVREGLLNALVHRDYFLNQSISFELLPDRLEIASPGGFPGGITADNVLRHTSVRRNPLLAEVLEKIGLVNRLGMGVDRMYRELLSRGKGPPAYEGDIDFVKLALPTGTRPSFAAFMAESERAGEAFHLDELIVLHEVSERGPLDRWSAGKALQLPDDAAAERLAEMRRRGLLEARSRGRATRYALAEPLARLSAGLEVDSRDRMIDRETAKSRIKAFLAERGRLSNAEVRDLIGYSAISVRRLIRELSEDGIVEVRGRGRGTHYVPKKGNPTSGMR